MSDLKKKEKKKVLEDLDKQSHPAKCILSFILEDYNLKQSYVDLNNVWPHDLPL